MGIWPSALWMEVDFRSFQGAAEPSQEAVPLIQDVERGVLPLESHRLTHLPAGLSETHSQM